MKYIKFVLISCLLLLIFHRLSSITHAQPVTPDPTSAPMLGEQIVLDDEDPKYPDVAMVNGQLFVSWSVDGKANLAEIGNNDSAGKIKVGEIKGDPNYFNTAIIGDARGTLHYVWIKNAKTILHKSRSFLGGWSEEHTVAKGSGSNFFNSIALGALGNELFAVWRGNEGDLQLARSSDGGVNWTLSSIPVRAYIGIPSFAANKKNLYLAWLGADFKIYVAKWNGTSFTYQAFFNRAQYAQPSIAILPDGRLVMATRSNDDAYFGEQQADGSWNMLQVGTGGGVTPKEAIAVDSSGNVHMTWVQYYKGIRQVMYGLKKPDDLTFLNPVPVTTDDHHWKVNLSMVVEDFGLLRRAHIFWEAFFIVDPTEEWPRHQIEGNTVITTVPLPTPPLPPCEEFANGQCVKTDSALGILSTFAGEFIPSIFAILLSLSGGAGVLIIIYAGYLYMTSRGKPEQIQKAKEILLSALIGFLFIIFSFTIFETISGDILNLPGFDVFNQCNDRNHQCP